jgi:hypothetical protein
VRTEGRSETQLVELATPFAESMRAKARLLHPTMGLTERQIRGVKESISEDFKKLGDVLFPEVRPFEVSRAAAKKARELNVDLQTHGWHSQARFDKNRRIFHIEHVTPVGALRTACIEAGSVDDIVAVIRTRFRLAWILKEEDARLTQLGFRSKRLNPDQAYQKAGIELLRE